MDGTHFLHEEETEYRPCGHLLPEMVLARELAGRRNGHLRMGADGGYRPLPAWPRAWPVGPWALYLQKGDGRFATLLGDFDGSKGDACGDALRDARDFYGFLVSLGVVAIPARSSAFGYHVWITVAKPFVSAEMVRELSYRLEARYLTFDKNPMCPRNPGKAYAAGRPPGAAGRRRADGSKMEPYERYTSWSEPCVPWTEAIRRARARNPPEAVQRLLEALPPAPKREKEPRAPRPTQADTLDRDDTASAAKETPQPAEDKRGRRRVAPPVGATKAELEEWIGQRAYSILHTGVRPGRDQSRSAKIRSVLRSCEQRGLTDSQTFTLLQDRGHVTAGHLAERAAEHGRTPAEEFAAEWAALDDGSVPPPGTPTDDHRSALLQIQVVIFDRGFGGRTGESDARVLRALIRIALRVGDFGFYVAERELWEAAANLSRNAIRVSLERLADPLDANRLFDISWGEDGEMNYVTFRRLSSATPPAAPERVTGDIQRVQVDEALRLQVADHDAWAGLPKAACTVFATLRHDKVATPSEVRAATGHGEEAVRRALKVLGEQELATNDVGRGRWRAAVPPSEVTSALDQVAERLRTVGTRAKQRAQIVKDRQQNRERLEQSTQVERIVDRDSGENRSIFTLERPKQKPKKKHRPKWSQQVDET